MKLPNSEQAVVDIAKLRDYSLDLTHKEGRHKARVFAAALGLTRNDADWLRDQLLAGAHVRLRAGPENKSRPALPDGFDAGASRKIGAVEKCLERAPQRGFS